MTDNNPESDDTKYGHVVNNPLTNDICLVNFDIKYCRKHHLNCILAYEHANEVIAAQNEKLKISSAICTFWTQ